LIAISIRDIQMSRRLLKGRLKKDMAADALQFLVSEDLEWDNLLVNEDITGSETHVLMLWRKKIIDKKTAHSILNALKKAQELYLKGNFKLDPELEDVHMNIESFVIAEAGMTAGGMLHIGRSRNDQVILDIRLHLRDKLNKTTIELIKLIKSILKLSEKYLTTIMPGYTHLQHAQPTTLAHWLTAYSAMLLRDLTRLEEAYKLVNLNPLGAAASVGTSWPIDREETAKLLGFDGVQMNSLDVITSRGEDVAEVLAALSVLMIHLSRMAEDLIIWSTHEFNMIELDDAYTMGSSIMPQKKNPDVAELIRGKTATIISQLFLTLTLMKGLPSGYFKDLQQTKYAAIKGPTTVNEVLHVLLGVLTTMKVNKKRMLELASAEFSTATDIADLLVKEAKIPFRMAHQITGSLVKGAYEAKKQPSQITLKDLNRVAMKTINRRVTISEASLKRALDPIKSVQNKRSIGSPNKTQVSYIIKGHRSEIRQKEKALKLRIGKVKEAMSSLEGTVAELLR